MQTKSTNVRPATQSLADAIDGYSRDLNTWARSDASLEDAAWRELLGFLNDLMTVQAHVRAACRASGTEQ